MTGIKVDPSILIREFKAPRQLVFDAWTQTDHLNQWMFPMPGCACDFVKADIVTGGTSLHKITMPNGMEMWLFTRYEDVSPPDRLVFFQYMSNEDGDIVPNPRMPTWPKDMLATLVFEDINDGAGTKLTFYWEPINPTKEEAETFESMRDQNGWAAGMEQLKAYLATVV
ncbi:MAG: SRPBCC domain-containing protein [Pseudomonadota bacterium]